MRSKDGPETPANSIADQLNAILEPHGIQLPADPTPEQMELAQAIIAFYADRQAETMAQAAEDDRLVQLAHDPSRKAAYDAARAACYYDTEALFPGWTPQALTPSQQADLDLCAGLDNTTVPSWCRCDPTRAALYDEASRLIPLSHGTSAQARAVRAEITRLQVLASRLGRQDARRRRRETPGTWARLDPWPATCQVCGQGIDHALAWPNPFSESLGHEPPISWALGHPEYDGPLVLRPEHLACNVAKGARPDSSLGPPTAI
jgi:hypothetical protein